MPQIVDNLPQGGKGKLIAILGAGGAALLVSTVAFFEGKRNDPYKDIVGVWTVCYGETQGPMRRFTDAECEEKLATALVRYAEPVQDCAGLKGRPNQLVAASSLAYNIGSKAFCGSTAARKFKAGDYKGGCAAMLSWNRAGGKVVRGLALRRQKEYKICMTGL
jgi:lysozyme